MTMGFSARDPAARALGALHGDVLDAAIARRFRVTEIPVTVGSQPHEHTYLLLKPENSDNLISEADYVFDERLPYWADLWPSARALAGVLMAEHGNGRTLLELGCGLGLATTAALAAGFDVTSTDYYEDAIHVARSNAWRNVRREPRVTMADWRHWPGDLGRFDAVIAADVLYEQEYVLLVADCIARSLRTDGIALVADPGRPLLPAFMEHLPAAGLRLEDTHATIIDDGSVTCEVQTLRIRRQQ